MFLTFRLSEKLSIYSPTHSSDCLRPACTVHMNLLNKRKLHCPNIRPDSWYACSVSWSKLFAVMTVQQEKQIPLSEDQRESILFLIAKHKSAILEDTHDPASITRKQEAWEKVTASLNAPYPLLPPRNTAHLTQLKRAFEYSL